MGFDWMKFSQLAQALAPMIISFVAPELVPLGTVIGHAVGEAESIPNSTGPQKLEHVKAIASDTANAINLASNKTVIDMNGFDQAVESGINTTVAVINLVGKSNSPIFPPTNNRAPLE